MQGEPQNRLQGDVGGQPKGTQQRLLDGDQWDSQTGKQTQRHNGVEPPSPHPPIARGSVGRPCYSSGRHPASAGWGEQQLLPGQAEGGSQEKGSRRSRGGPMHNSKAPGAGMAGGDPSRGSHWRGGSPPGRTPEAMGRCSGPARRGRTDTWIRRGFRGAVRAGM